MSRGSLIINDSIIALLRSRACANKTREHRCTGVFVIALVKLGYGHYREIISLLYFCRIFLMHGKTWREQRKDLKTGCLLRWWGLLHNLLENLTKYVFRWAVLVLCWVPNRSSACETAPLSLFMLTVWE